MDDQRIEQAQAAIGHVFADESLLRTALTHPSYAAEHADADNYDRLEFLGDAVLGFVVSAYVYAMYPDATEGELTRRKHGAVSGSMLAETAEQLGLARFVLMGAGAHAAGERQRASVLENAVEALIGALYLDGGLDVARAFIIRILGSLLAEERMPELDPKGALQQWTQATNRSLPAYRIVDVTGPVHQRTFTAEVLIGGTVRGAGVGHSKQAAEKAAAAEALTALDEAPESAE